MFLVSFFNVLDDELCLFMSTLKSFSVPEDLSPKLQIMFLSLSQEDAGTNDV